MGGLRGLGLFTRFVVPDGASCGCPQYAMMARDVPGGTADHRTLKAALCVSRHRSNGDREREKRAA